MLSDDESDSEDSDSDDDSSIGNGDGFYYESEERSEGEGFDSDAEDSDDGLEGEELGEFMEDERNAVVVIQTDTASSDYDEVRFGYPSDYSFRSAGEDTADMALALSESRGVDDEDDSVDRLSFEFYKLERLALGMGNVHSLVSERVSMHQLVLAMAPYRSRMAALQQVYAYVSLDDVKDGLQDFQDVVQRSVHHMYLKSRPSAYSTFSNIRRIQVIIYSTYLSIPLRLDVLEQFEILVRRPVFVNDYNKPSVSKRMARTAQSLLNALLRGVYPNLKTVSVWKCTVMHHEEIDNLVVDNRDRFRDLGVVLEARTREVVFDVPGWYHRAQEPCAQTV